MPEFVLNRCQGISRLSAPLHGCRSYWQNPVFLQDQQSPVRLLVVSSICRRSPRISTGERDLCNFAVPHPKSKADAGSTSRLF